LPEGKIKWWSRGRIALVTQLMGKDNQNALRIKFPYEKGGSKPPH